MLGGRFLLGGPKGGETLLVHTLLFEGEVEGKISGGPPAPGGELQSSSGRIMQ